MGKYDNIHDTISKYKDDFQKYTHKINPLYKETLPKFIRQYIACIFDIYYLLPFYIGFKIGDIILNKVYDKILIQRDFVPKNIKKVKMPPELTVDFLVTDEIDHKYEENLQKEIDKFLNVLENNFNRESLAFFFRNIKSLDFKEMAEKENDDTLGVYNVIQNNIRLLKEDNNNTLFHELFHMASSYRDEENKISYCGFHQTKKNYDLGRGINEGYTELLANRYSDYNSHYCYYCEKKYAKIIEDIIGKELMQNLYLQANLKGLITELTKYQSEEKIMQFIQNLDIYNKYEDDEKLKEKVNSCIKNIETFLMETYLEKTKIELKEMSFKDKNALKNFIYDVRTKTYDIQASFEHSLTPDEINIIISNYLDDIIAEKEIQIEKEKEARRKQRLEEEMAKFNPIITPKPEFKIGPIADYNFVTGEITYKNGESLDNASPKR